MAGVDGAASFSRRRRASSSLSAQFWFLRPGAGARAGPTLVYVLTGSEGAEGVLALEDAVAEALVVGR